MIYDVLRGVPGISVQHLGGPANWTYIRTRGGKEIHTKVLINGAEDIERIKIEKIRINVQETRVNWSTAPYYKIAEAHMETQWDRIIYPLIRGYDFSKVLELAPGHGRNTEKLKDLAGEIHLVGFFNDSLNDKTRKTFDMKKISVALIDCDLYSSTVDVLNFIQKMVIDKTILIFDDWNAFDKDNNRGQRKAFREFSASNKNITAEDYFSYGAYGKVFILTVKN